MDQSDRTGTDSTERAGRYQHLVEHIQDAVVEFELREGVPVVRHVNEAFVEVFGYSREEVVGASLNEWIVPEWLRAEAERLDRQTAAGEINYQRVTRETANGLREFLYRSIPYETDETGGFAVYTDLSAVTRKERRLQVMNRVLRHNLRNNTNLILAHATRLCDAVDERETEVTDAAAAVQRVAHDLEKLTRDVTDVRRVLDGPDCEVPSVDCVPLVRQVARDHRDASPEADIETQLPEALFVTATQDLTLAVDHLVENAIEHNPAETPRVRVSATTAAADGWVDLRVEDDGPEIPAQERAVLSGQAEITPTQHVSGLGLWVVKWTVDAFGGDLSFASSTLGGNCVCLRLSEASDTAGG